MPRRNSHAQDELEEAFVERDDDIQDFAMNTED
jgi:hypothetical protein